LPGTKLIVMCPSAVPQGLEALDNLAKHPEVTLVNESDHRLRHRRGSFELADVNLAIARADLSVHGR
jgi:hypothetical protein